MLGDTDGYLGRRLLKMVNGGIEAALLFGSDLFAPAKEGGGGLAARHNEGETAQSGLRSFARGHAGIWRGAGENAQDSGTLRPGEFTACAEGGSQIGGFEDGCLSGRR